jgi:hypothetical protein
MRKAFTILILLLAMSAQAQITLTAATSNPLPGDTASFYVVDGNNIYPGISGAAVTWDYSTLTSANKKTRYYHLPGTVCDPYPGPLASSGTGSCDYYHANSDSISLSRSIFGTYSKYEPNNRIILKYPLTYNSQLYTDTYDRTDSVQGPWPSFWQYGTQQIYSDAYGTLILPDSTYTNVLRVKKQVHFLTDFPFTSGTVYTDIDIYEWYSADHRTFLLQVNNMIHDGLSVSEKSISEVNIYPNPASGKFNIELDSAPIHIYLKDITGKKLREIDTVKGQQKCSMDVSGFAAGIYFLEVATVRGILVKKIQVL